MKFDMWKEFTNSRVLFVCVCSSEFFLIKYSLVGGKLTCVDYSDYALYMS